MDRGGPRIDVVKADGRSEEFDPAKLHTSIVQTCLSVKTPEGQAELIAKTAVVGVLDWCQGRPEITTRDIRRIAEQMLTRHHTEAAYLYKQHRTMI